MPPSKNAFIRYRIIDKCLRDQERAWTKKDITNKVNKHLSSVYGITVSEGSIRHDLDDIEIYFDIEIERYPAGKPRFYRYKDPENSLFNLPLNKTDVAKITKALELIASVKGLELDEELKPVIASLQNRTMIKGPETKRVLQFDHQPFATGSNYVIDILESIQQQTPLKISYMPFYKNEPSDHHFHPYMLKEYNNRWFCIGYCSSSYRVLTICLDRIIDAPRVLKQKYIPNTFFDPNTYFNDIVGVTHPTNGQKQVIRLEFSRDRFPYINNKPIHESQTIEEIKADGRAIIKLEIIPNKELISYILSFGEDVIVLSPEGMVQEIRSKLEKAIYGYT